MQRLIFIVLGLAGLAGAVALGYHFRPPVNTAALSTESAPATSPLLVSIGEVTLRNSQEFQQFAGSLQSRVSVQVSARITAHVVELKVHSGQQVKKDEVLVRLDDADVKTRIRQMEAAVGAAEAAVRGAEAELAKAQAAKEEADKDLWRYQDMYKHGGIAEQQVQQHEAKAKMAAAGIDQAKEGITEARKQVTRAQALVQEAKDNLEYTVIRSPMNGVVVEKQAEEGDLAAPGRPLLMLQDPDALRFEAPVSESCARRIALGDRVRVLLDTAQSEIPAEVSEIVPAVDPKSRSFLVRANLPTQTGLKTGIFGRLQFPCAARLILSIPTSAKIARGQLDFVFVVNDNHARLRLITIGRAQGEWLEVLSGLAQGEKLVIQPPAELRDGAPVQEAKP